MITVDHPYRTCGQPVLLFAPLLVRGTRLATEVQVVQTVKRELKATRHVGSECGLSCADRSDHGDPCIGRSCRSNRSSVAGVCRRPDARRPRPRPPAGAGHPAMWRRIARPLPPARDVIRTNVRRRRDRTGQLSHTRTNLNRSTSDLGAVTERTAGAEVGHSHGAQIR